MVHVELRVGGDPSEIVTQWWDASRGDYSASCSAAPRGDGFYDQNGDGFCAWNVTVWGAEQYDLRATRAR
jgi:hypothetical protein